MDESFKRVERALIAAGLAFGATGLSQAVPILARFSTSAAWVSLLLAVGMLFAAFGLLISCAFVGSKKPSILVRSIPDERRPGFRQDDPPEGLSNVELTKWYDRRWRGDLDGGTVEACSGDVEIFGRL